MERICIAELQLKYLGKHGRELTREELAEVVFKDDPLFRSGGGEDPMPNDRKLKLLSRWNKGHELRLFMPRHLKRLSDFFESTDLNDFIMCHE